MNKYLATAVWAFLLVSVPPAAYGTDAEARALVTRANRVNDGSKYGLQEAFCALWDAYGEADSSRLRSSIENSLSEVSRRYERVLQEGYPAFLDVPHDSSRAFYQKYAKYGNRIGLRLYGELLLQEGDERGFDYVLQAAHKKDARAEFIVGETLGIGKYGQEQDFTNGYNWLTHSAAHDYAPACELLAKIHWNGIWKKRRDYAQAMRYMDSAISLFGRWTLGNKSENQAFQNYLYSLRFIKETMDLFSRADLQAYWATYPSRRGVVFSYEFMHILSLYDQDSNDTLWQIGLLLNDMMESYGGQFMTGPTGSLDIWRIPMRWKSYKSLNRKTGEVDWVYDEYTYEASISIARPTYEDDQVMKIAKVVDTLAHEIAHAHFCARYPLLLGDTDHKRVHEGHSTNAAYAVMNSLLYAYDLSPEDYARIFLDNEYARYFHWFRNNCLLDNGYVNWDKLDSMEAGHHNSRGRVRTRSPRTSKPRVYAPYDYYGHNFYGFL